ncbi:hypothetical protein ACS0TY_008440 [Phlomoides rotata]
MANKERSSKETVDPKEMIPKVDNIFKFQSTKSESKWLEKCLTGTLKKGFSWNEHGDEMSEECGDTLNLKFLGDNNVLIQNLSDKPLNVIEKDMDEWFTLVRMVPSMEKFGCKS